MNPKRLVLFLAACGLAMSAQGADLLGVYRDALASDPVYQSARAQYQASIERLPQARAGYLPLITGVRPRPSATTTTSRDAPNLDYHDDAAST